MANLPGVQCFYFPLEPVDSRYTHQLCNEATGWMPKALRDAFQPENFIGLYPSTEGLSGSIKVGAVLDAHARTTYALRQCGMLLDLMAAGKVRDDDVVYLQDFYTPGLDSIFYSAHLYGIKVRFAAMLHAQSVDTHDFTYEMRRWMRPLEKAYASQMGCIFVASSVHRDMLLADGVIPRGQIHVVGLPFSVVGFPQVEPLQYPKQNRVIYASRVDREKNPRFMLRVAEEFLRQYPDWDWVCTTSAPKFRSYNDWDIRDAMQQLSDRCPTFIIKEGLTKPQYHEQLQRAKIQFNCASQDFVSWTLIESQYFGCCPVYPDTMSFPECLGAVPLYTHLDERDALGYLTAAVKSPWSAHHIPDLMDSGRALAAGLCKMTDAPKHFNIWDHQ